jgi:hypothetical protein
MVNKKKSVKKIKKLDAKIMQKDVNETGVHVTANLNAIKFGIAGGIVCAICVMITTLAGIYGYFTEYNSLIISIYGFLGYTISWVGIFIGAIYAFIDGFIATWLFAFIYNKLI